MALGATDAAAVEDQRQFTPGSLITRLARLPVALARSRSRGLILGCLPSYDMHGMASKGAQGTMKLFEHPDFDLPPLNSTTFSARIRGFLVARTICQETLHD